MPFKGIVLTTELLDNYHKLWGGLGAQKLADLKDENAQRVMMVRKMLFIEILSSFEFVAKKVYKKNSVNKNVELQQKGKLSLWELLKIPSSEDESCVRWDGIIKLRNFIIHNNAVSDIDNKFKFPTFELVYKNGSNIRGNWGSFNRLITSMMPEFDKWFVDISKLD